MTWELQHGNCRQLMAAMEGCSVDSIVTDPPYELGFMGREWDRSGVAYDVEMWRAALDVLKPGGWLVAFGGDRSGEAASGSAAHRAGLGIVEGVSPSLKTRANAVAFGGGNTSGPLEIATAQTAHGARLDFDSETFVMQAGVTRENPDSGPDGVGVQTGAAYTLEARAETQIVAHPTAATLTRGAESGGKGGYAGRRQEDDVNLVAHSLRAEGFDASEDGAGRGTPIVPVAFQGRGSNIDIGQDVTGTLGLNCDRASGGSGLAVA